MAVSNRYLFGHLLLLIIAFIYGSLFVVGKLVLTELPAESLTLFRVAAASLVLLGIFISNAGRKPSSPPLDKNSITIKYNQHA